MERSQGLIPGDATAIHLHYHVKFFYWDLNHFIMCNISPLVCLTMRISQFTLILLNTTNITNTTTLYYAQ